MEQYPSCSSSNGGGEGQGVIDGWDPGEGGEGVGAGSRTTTANRALRLICKFCFCLLCSIERTLLLTRSWGIHISFFCSDRNTCGRYLSGKRNGWLVGSFVLLG